MAKNLTFYGKKTCVTCQKAKAYLQEQGVAFEDLEIEKTPPTPEVLNALVDGADVKASLNIRSAIYKAQDLGKHLPSKAQAIALMQQDPNLIKRPVIVDGDGQLYQGFDPESLAAFLKG